jgi:soluble lytic murein transglycosylase
MAPRELPELASTIVREAARNDLDPALVMAVIEVESSFYHRAVSRVGALGLMQLLPSTAAEIAQREGLVWRGADSLFDPILNVKLGTSYLKELSLRFEDLHAALAAYNWGPGRIQRRLNKGHTLPVEYVRRVMSSYTDADPQAGRT